jgi:drug/metabolite transporter (DMT)-like permease
MGELAGLTLVLAGAASHGLSYTLGKQGVAGTDVVTFSLFRSGCSTLFLLGVFLLFGYWRSFQELPFFALSLALLSACLNFWTMLGFFWALRLGRLSVMAPLHMSYPLFVFVFGTLFLKESVSLSLVLGAIGILSGVTLLSVSRDRSDRGPASRRQSLLGCLLALSSSLSWGSSLVVDKSALEYMPALTLNLIKIGLPSVAFFLLTRLQGPLPSLAQGTRIRAVASGLLGLVVANLLYFGALKYSDSVWVAPLSSTSMLFSIFFAVVLLGERLRRLDSLGAGLVFAGVWLILGR